MRGVHQQSERDGTGRYASNMPCEITRSGLALCNTSAFVSMSYTFLRAHPFQHRLPPETSEHRRKIGAEQRHQPSRAGGDIMDAHPITRSRPLRSAHKHATRMGVHPPCTIFRAGRATDAEIAERAYAPSAQRAARVNAGKRRAGGDIVDARHLADPRPCTKKELNGHRRFRRAFIMRDWRGLRE